VLSQTFELLGFKMVTIVETVEISDVFEPI
jgi:hypothetical protein